VTIWRGGSLPDQFPAAHSPATRPANLIHADGSCRRGATFWRRNPSWMGANSLRPAMTGAGRCFSPGAGRRAVLCDMYRKVIEHPDYLACRRERKHTDYRERKAMGRHLAPVSTQRRTGTPPNHAEGGSPVESIAMIGTGSPWQRPQRSAALIERPDPSQLTRFAAEFEHCKTPAARPHFCKRRKRFAASAGSMTESKLRSLLAAGQRAADPRYARWRCRCGPSRSGTISTRAHRWWTSLAEDADPPSAFEFALGRAMGGPKPEVFRLLLVRGGGKGGG